jgi:hypothetical protein
MKVTPTFRVITTASVCAVVIVLGFLFWATLAYAQATSTPVEETPAPVSAEPQGYTTEFVDSPSGSIPGDFVVGPGKAELVINPGESRTIELLVTNRTGQLRQFNFEVEDAVGSYNPLNPVVLLGEDRGPYTLKDYISYPNRSIDLEHNERARIPVTVSVPMDAEPGGRYGSLLVTTVTKNAEADPSGGASAGSAIVSRVGTLFFVTVPGEVNTEGELQSFATIPDRKFFTQGPINFQLLFENKGDIHLSPYGDVRITNLFDEEVGFVELDPWFALPKSLRVREISWDRELLIGRYTATANVNRGYDDIYDTQTITFWVLPWMIIVPIFLALFVLFFLIRFFAKNFEFKRKGD